jgi:hypothetical protein
MKLGGERLVDVEEIILRETRGIFERDEHAGTDKRNLIQTTRANFGQRKTHLLITWGCDSGELYR